MRFDFFFSEALGSLRRNWVMTIAATLIVFTSMFILGGVLVSKDNLNAGMLSVENDVKINVYLKTDATDADIAAFRAMLEANPDVKKSEFVSKEQGLEQVRQTMGDEMVANLPTNPLPDMFKVYAKSTDGVEALAAQMAQQPQVGTPKSENVRFPKKTVRALLRTIGILEKAMWGVVFLFAMTAGLLIFTTVRLSIFARRREIEIMRLVGASNWFIRSPFLLEGFITGLAGSALASAGILALNWLLYDWVKSSDINYPVQMYSALQMFGVLGGLSMVLGGIGCGLAIQRHLKI